MTTEASPLQLYTHEENAAVYAAVVASALDAVVVVDEEGIVVTVNPAAEATFGYKASEAVGRSIAALIVPDHLKAAHDAGMARYRSTREPHVLGRRVEMEARCKDGRIIPVELAITEVNLPSRRLFTANLRDLSAARQAAAEIERHRESLHQNEKLAAIGSLLAGVAHELNNPLSIVIGQASLLHEEMEAGVQGAVLVSRAEKIQAAADRCARVVKSFLAIARRRKAETSIFPVAAVLDASVELLLYGLNSSGITVTRDYETNGPPVLADRDQVQNVVVNLLVNAMQALEAIEPPREIGISARTGADGHMHVIVADNGPGIPADHAQRIFDPFFTTKPQGAGTGIGLSISRGLAEAQGGTLTLASTPGPGAAFDLTLPLAGMEPTMTDASRSEPIEPRVQPGRVIVVDDEPDIAALIADAIRRAGLDCDIATCGSDAQRLIAADPDGYDVIVSDLRMPDVDGPALFRWLSANHPYLTDKTVFITGDALGPVARAFLAESGRPVLEKPFTPAEIALLVTDLSQR